MKAEKPDRGQNETIESPSTESVMRVDLAHKLIVIEASSPTTLDRYAGYRMVVISGGVWVTTPDKAGDHVLKPGDSLLIPGDGKVVFEAVELSKVRLEAPVEAEAAPQAA